MVEQLAVNQLGAGSSPALAALLTLNYKIMHSFGAYIVGAIVLVVLYYIFKDSTI